MKPVLATPPPRLWEDRSRPCLPFYPKTNGVVLGTGNGSPLPLRIPGLKVRANSMPRERRGAHVPHRETLTRCRSVTYRISPAASGQEAAPSHMSRPLGWLPSPARREAGGEVGSAHVASGRLRG